MDSDFASKWQLHHGGVGVDANLWIKAWLRVIMGPAKLMARLGVAPSLLTAVGLVLSLSTVVVAYTGRERWHLVICALLVLASSYFDGLDGAVALLRDRVSAFGARFDRISDRLSEVCWVLMLMFFGGAFWLGVSALIASWSLEWVRWRASRSGLVDSGLITVGERPTRVAIVASCMLAAAVFVQLTTFWANAALVALVLVGAIGIWQVRRGF